MFCRISQVSKSYNDVQATDKLPALVLSTSPLIVVAGDAFLGSKFDNCLISAKYTAALLTGQTITSSSL